MTKQFPMSDEAKKEAARSRAHRARMNLIFAGDKSAKFDTTPRKGKITGFNYFNEHRDIRRFG